MDYTDRIRGCDEPIRNVRVPCGFRSFGWRPIPAAPGRLNEEDVARAYRYPDLLRTERPFFAVRDEPIPVRQTVQPTHRPERWVPHAFTSRVRDGVDVGLHL